MRRTILILLATLLTATTLLADSPGVYRLTLAATSAADARDIVHLYGGRIVAVARQSGELTLRISADGAKSLSRDPRVVRLTAANSITNGSVAVDDVPDIVLGPYQYDGSGNIRTIGSEQFLYDRNTRLVSAATVPGTQTFNYDAFGNRTTATTTGIVKCNDGADCALYPNVDVHTNHISGSQTHYDDAGNLAQSDGRAYTYDGFGMMTSQDAAQLTQYVYTAEDERIAVYNGTRWEWSLRDPTAHVLRQFTSDDIASAPASTGWTWSADNVFRGTLLLAAEHPGSGRRHFHVDHLGTPRLITSDGGSIAGSYEYYAFGTQPDAGAREIPLDALKFTGHERDLASGEVHVLDYMHARYYDGVVGRFLSVDPEAGSPLSPQSFNRYAYVLNNAMNRTDPTGKCGEPDDFVGPPRPCDETITVTAKAPTEAEMKLDAAMEIASETIDRTMGTVVTMSGVGGILTGIHEDNPTQIAKGLVQEISWAGPGAVAAGAKPLAASGNLIGTTTDITVNAMVDTPRVLARAAEAGAKDLGHNFPAMLDSTIVQSGQVEVKSANYIQFSAPGHINNVAGEYQIGGKLIDGILYVAHRAFIGF